MIKGTVGRGGSGKSLTTVQRLWQLHKMHGRAVYSNTPLIDLRVKRRAAGFFSAGASVKSGTDWLPVDAEKFGTSWAEGYVTSFEQIYGLDNCEVFLDELAAWMPSHKHSKMPDEVRRFLAQDRREGVNVWWTHRTTKVFHEVLENTSELTRCSRYGPLVVGEVVDPEDKAGKAVKRYTLLSPMIYDLYQTLARVGDSEGKGYGMGGRSGYGHLRSSQRQCLIRKFGPHAVGYHLEQLNQTGMWDFGYSTPARYVLGPGTVSLDPRFEPDLAL